MKILVTGGLGFIGSNFIRNALSKHPDKEIINIDKIGVGANPENLQSLKNARQQAPQNPRGPEYVKRRNDNRIVRMS